MSHNRLSQGASIFFYLTTGKFVAMLRRMFSYEKEFANEIRRFQNATGLTDASFGRLSPLRDPGFLRAMYAGRSPTARTMDKIREWMYKQQPDVIRKSPCDKKSA